METVVKKLATIKREEAMKKIKGSWDRSGGVKFSKEKELRVWRRSLWSSTEKRLTRKS